MSEVVPPPAESLLESEPLVAFLGTSRDDKPHVAPVWYRYEDASVEIATTGQKLENIRANPRVSLAVQKAENGIPEWVVTLRGTATVIDDEGETRQALRRINRKYGAADDAWAENTLVRIDVGSTSYTEY